MDAVFTDEAGRTGMLRSWFDGKPVAMALVYYRCIMLCPQVLYGLASGLRQTTLIAGKDYDVVIVSIDPMDKPSDAANEKAKFLEEAGFGSPNQNSSVHFLTGAEQSIQAVAAAAGFHYVRVPGPDGKMDQFAHSSVIMFATPEGKMSEYLAGINYPARDLRLALLGASQRRISNPVDLLILYCCNYNPASGRYTVAVERILGLAAMVTLVIVAPYPYLRCIAQVLEKAEPAEKCTGVATDTVTRQHAYGVSGALSWNTAHNKFSVGAGFDRGGLTFVQNSQYGYINSDGVSITRVNWFEDGTEMDDSGQPYDDRVNLHGTTTQSS